jgi:microcystin-dependent protein
MTVEAATYIADLQPVNPPSTDPRSQGDDHLRLIKQVLQNTFANASRQIQFPTTRAVSTNYTAVKNDGEGTIYVSTASGAVTITLPGLAGGDAGWRVFICKTTLDVNPVFITPTAGGLSSGGYSVSKCRRCIPGRRVAAIWDGTNWFVERGTELPIGTLLDFYSTTLPAGFEWPNGQTLASVATNYPEYNVVQGSGATPDLRGYSVITLDNLGGTAAGRLPNGQISGSVLGATGGVDASAITAAQMPAHQHNVYLKDPGHTHTASTDATKFVLSGTQTTASGGYNLVTGVVTINSASTSITIGSVSGTANDNQTASAGSGAIRGNLQPSIMCGKILVVE